MSDDSYVAIAEGAELRQKIERSDFLGIAFAVKSEEQFFAELQRIEKKHFDATHHCWAFRLRDRARSSDAGEPSGTAGKPILTAIEGASLREAAVVVVRWYGGVKLGTGGLSRAYRETAAGALRLVKTVERFDYVEFRVVVPFDRMSHAFRLADPPHVLLAGESYAEENEFTFRVRRGMAEEFGKRLTELRLSFRA